ncbi:ribonuclease pancreatic [Hyla sarda]|uniref:ribonuclease pancreatic n=1 Tax=Hyla sarda TaxID=327740 RepID=UPI0024C416CF|nr:ribonuclease pancreatic [Hyla sarda]
MSPVQFLLITLGIVLLGSVLCSYSDQAENSFNPVTMSPFQFMLGMVLLGLISCSYPNQAGRNYDEFNRRHVRGNRTFTNCTDFMKREGIWRLNKGKCKPFNTLIFAKTAVVKKICLNQNGTTCWSKNKFKVVECATSKSRPPCIYKQTDPRKLYVKVKCEGMRPVHLNETSEKSYKRGCTAPTAS